MKIQEKMLFDRMKLQINLNVNIKENIKNIEKNLKERGKFIRNADRFKNFYMIKKGFFNLYYYPVNKFLILDFNMQRYFMDVNIGGVTNREALKVINVINYYIKNNIGIGLDIREWIVYNVELKKDIKYSSSKEKKIIIDTYKKCSRGNMKTGEYKSSYYRFSNNGNKISIYDKEEEVKSHRSWGRVKIEEKAIIHDTVRFEVAFSQKKLRKILDVKDKVLFKNLLNVGIQEKIYNDFFLKMGFKVGEMPTKTALIKDIKNLALGTKKIENLITFVETLNIYTFKKVKELFPSAYTYLKILRDNNLVAYFIDTEKILEEAIKESKVKENTFYSSILNGCYEVLYNIYYIINNIFILREIKLE